MLPCIVGMDVGGTNIRLGAVTEDGRLIHEYKTSSGQIRGSQAGEKLLEILKEYCAALENIEICAVSIGFPSTMNRERTKVLSTPNIPGLDQAEFGVSYTEALGIPVWGEKDSCMLMYYDMKVNRISTDGLSIGIYVGTGLGNVIMLNGEPLPGKNGVAGELGHIPVIGRNERCGCGLEGCLELYAGGRGLKEVLAKHYPEEFIGDIFKNHAGEEPVEEYLKCLAQALCLEITILDPDHICLGGGVLNMEGFPTARLLELIKKYTRHPLPSDDLDIIFSKQDSVYNGVIGAGLYGWHRFNQNN